MSSRNLISRLQNSELNALWQKVVLDDQRETTANVGLQSPSRFAVNHICGASSDGFRHRCGESFGREFPLSDVPETPVKQRVGFSDYRHNVPFCRGVSNCNLVRRQKRGGKAQGFVSCLQLFWGNLQGEPKPLAARPLRCARGSAP